MDDSEGVFGGNGSVEWAIDAGNNPKWQTSTPKAPKGHMQAGAEETPPDESFRVFVKRPKKDDDVSVLIADLVQWLEDLKDRSIATSSFKLKIEEKNTDQIRVTWRSVDPVSGQ